MRKLGKPLFVVFLLATMTAVGGGLYSIYQARSKTLARLKCEGRDYLIVRKDYSKDARFYIYLTIEERASGLKLEWPKEARTSAREGDPAPITLWSASAAPKKILDLSVPAESSEPAPHIECLKKLMPEVRQVLLGIVPPYAGVPEFVSADDEAVLLWP